MKKKIILSIIFMLYIFGLLWLTILRRDPKYGEAELDLLWELQKIILGENYNKSYFTRRMVYNLICNLVVFIPFGALLPAICSRLQRWWAIMLTGFSMTLLIEVTQYFTDRGIFETNDLFFDTLGAVLGYFIWKYFAGREVTAWSIVKKIIMRLLILFGAYLVGFGIDVVMISNFHSDKGHPALFFTWFIPEMTFFLLIVVDIILLIRKIVKKHKGA